MTLFVHFVCWKRGSVNCLASKRTDILTMEVHTFFAKTAGGSVAFLAIWCPRSPSVVSVPYCCRRHCSHSVVVILFCIFTTFTAGRAKVIDGSPTIAELNKLSAKVLGNWEFLARRLDVEETEIERVRSDNVQFPAIRQKAFQVLKIWWDQDEASYSRLVKALEAEGLGLHAEQFYDTQVIAVRLFGDLGKVVGCFGELSFSSKEYKLI